MQKLYFDHDLELAMIDSLARKGARRASLAKRIQDPINGILVSCRASGDDLLDVMDAFKDVFERRGWIITRGRALPETNRYAIIMKYEPIEDCEDCPPMDAPQSENDRAYFGDGS